jgi:hypothetical protein
MPRQNRILLLVALAILLLFLVYRESYHLYSELRQLNLPTQQTRQPLGRNAHGWMNAEELARFYKVPVESVFTALNIQPAPGDEKLTLKDLAQKYNKTPAEIDAAINTLNNQSPLRGGNRDG